MHKAAKLGLGAALAAAFAATAFAQVTPDRVIKYRQSAFQVMAWNMGPMAAMVKGERPYDKDEVAKNAAIAEQMSKLPWDGFVAGSDKGETGAKPEIWTDAAKFKSAGEKMQQEMSKLAQAANSGDLNAIKAQFGETGKACKACHDDFRKKP